MNTQRSESDVNRDEFFGEFISLFGLPREWTGEFAKPVKQAWGRWLDGCTLSVALAAIAKLADDPNRKVAPKLREVRLMYDIMVNRSYTQDRTTAGERCEKCDETGYMLIVLAAPDHQTPFIFVHDPEDVRPLWKTRTRPDGAVVVDRPIVWTSGWPCSCERGRRANEKSSTTMKSENLEKGWQTYFRSEPVQFMRDCYRTGP